MEETAGAVRSRRTGFELGWTIRRMSPLCDLLAPRSAPRDIVRLSDGSITVSAERLSEPGWRALIGLRGHACPGTSQMLMRQRKESVALWDGLAPDGDRDRSGE